MEGNNLGTYLALPSPCCVEFPLEQAENQHPPPSRPTVHLPSYQGCPAFFLITVSACNREFVRREVT